MNARASSPLLQVHERPLAGSDPNLPKFEGPADAPSSGGRAQAGRPRAPSAADDGRLPTNLEESEAVLDPRILEAWCIYFREGKAIHGRRSGGVPVTMTSRGACGNRATARATP
eukprot:6237993-Pyramimonas_sp.AAC.1